MGFGIYKDRLEKELRELEEKIEGQKDREKVWRINCNFKPNQDAHRKQKL